MYIYIYVRMKCPSYFQYLREFCTAKVAEPSTDLNVDETIFSRWPSLRIGYGAK